VGTKLQEARKRVGISLRQIADSTKVSINTLQALERNEFSRLPGGLFARGYVRSFAIEVGLDPEVTVAEFVEQSPVDSVRDGYVGPKGAGANEPVDAQPVEAPVPRPGWQNISTAVSFAATGILLAATAGYLVTTKRWSQSAARPSDTATVRSQADGTVRTGHALEQTVLAAAPEVQKPPSRKAPVQSVPAPRRPSNVPEHADAPPPAPAPEDSTRAASSTFTATSKSDSATTSGEPAETNSGKPIEAAASVRDRLAVVLSVTRASWVIAFVDGKKVFSRLVDVGEEETLEARRELVLTVGDAGAIVMTINGTVARSLGQMGQTVTAHVNRRNVKNYLRE
jgi:cytoskeleton protein RodZ